MPFAALLWVMLIKLFMGGDIYKNNVTPGRVPQVEQDASADLVHRTAGEHGARSRWLRCIAARR